MSNPNKPTHDTDKAKKLRDDELEQVSGGLERVQGKREGGEEPAGETDPTKVDHRLG